MSNAQETVLVSGITGYLASHVALQLLKGGFRVRGTVRSLEKKEKYRFLETLCPEAKSNLEFVQANLLDSDCWTDATNGCDYVMHLASPFPIEEPEDEMELIQPAVDGTLNVLKACVSSSVKRVILTSSMIAIRAGHQHDPYMQNHVFTEEDWSNPEHTTAYGKSKTLAERAAWKFLDDLDESKRFEMVVINPTFILGPSLSGRLCSSLKVCKRLLDNDMPGIPELSLNIVDVRDVASAHCRAMEHKLPVPADKSKVPRERFIVWSETVWFKQMAEIIEAEFQPQGYSIPTMQVPKCCLWCVATCCGDKEAGSILDQIGHRDLIENKKARTQLGMTFRPASESIVATAYSLINHGLCPDKRQDTEQSALTDADNGPSYNAV